MTTTSAAGSNTAASLVSALGSGSGIDTGALIDKLIEAQFATKTKQLDAQSDAIEAKISGVAKIKGGIAGFDSALRALVKGGTLSTQPTSADAGVVTATTLPGARLGSLDTTIGVVRLATAQAATTRNAVARNAGFQQGTLTISVGDPAAGTPRAFPPIAVGAGDTLATIAGKINAAATGITATVVGDGAGARLTLKGGTGAAQAFTVSAVPADGADPAAVPLAMLAVGTGNDGAGARIGSVAGDAELTVDGATFTRPTNSIGDLVTGVRLELKAAGTTTLTATTPTAALEQAVNDFVATYNAYHATLVEELDPLNGTLRGDTAASNLQRSLAGLTTVPLTRNANGTSRTLGDIGVATQRDGTLSVDAARLTAVLSRDPKAVEAMFADGVGASQGGLSAALGAIAKSAANTDYGLDASTGRYTKQQKTIADAKDRIDADSVVARTRMTQQFAAMDSRIAAYKAQQTFLENQIKAWNGGDG